MSRFAKRILLIVLLLCSVACSGNVSRLDEEIFYKGPALSLKLVRYYENLPFHYSGEIYVVSCSSPATAAVPAHRTQDRGWVQVGNGGAIGSRTAHDLVDRVRPRYKVLNDHILVVTGTVLQVSFDACGSFERWDPTTVPADMITPLVKPDFCKPKGLGDCRYMDFEGERAPQYEDIDSVREGALGFKVESRAFKDNLQLRIATEDFGKTWSVLAISK